MADPARHVDPVHYPESDGKPMGETRFHSDAMVDIAHQLRWHLRDSPHDHYVGNDNFWYFVEGDPRKVVVPDVYLVRGYSPATCPPRIWKTWVHGVVPSVVFEVTSRSTRREDLGPKRAIYQSLGVSEVWLFDPTGEYLEPRLRGFVRGPSDYAEILPSGGRWHSPWLDVDLSLDDKFLALTRGSEPRPPRLYDIPAALAGADSARAEADSARSEADSARARIAELEAEIARIRRLTSS